MEKFPDQILLYVILQSFSELFKATKAEAFKACSNFQGFKVSFQFVHS